MCNTTTELRDVSDMVNCNLPGAVVLELVKLGGGQYKKKGKQVFVLCYQVTVRVAVI